MRWKGWIILGLLPLIVACSAVRLTYNQGPTLAYWWLDGYADFTAEQSPRVKAALDAWFVWHRATQLTDYAQALAALQTQIVDKVTPAQVCGQLQDWQQRIERAFEQALPAMAEQVQGLSPAQLQRIEARQKKKQQDAEEDFLQDDPADRQKATQKRWVDRAETLYGTLNSTQRQWLATELASSPFKPELWAAERRLRQQDITLGLRQWQAGRPEPIAVQAGLRRLALGSLQSPRRDYQAYADALAQANCTLTAGLHNSTTPAQRQHAVGTLKGWESDLRALAAQRQ